MKHLVVPGLVALSLLLPASRVGAQTSAWVGGDGLWSSTGTPGWNGPVPNAAGAIVTLGASTGVTTTTVDTTPTVGTISLANGSASGWTFAGGSITLNQDGAGGSPAQILNANSDTSAINSLSFTTGSGVNLTLADNLLVSNTGGSTGTSIYLGRTITGTGNVTFSNSSNSQTPSGGAILIGGTGTGSPAGVANSFTGSVLLQRGTTFIHSVTSLGSTSNAVTLGQAGQGSVTLGLPALKTTYAYDVTVAAGTGGTTAITSLYANLSGAQALNGAFVLNGSLAASSAGGRLAFNGVISGPGGLIINGGRVSVTNPNNTYTGLTTVNAGEFNLGGSAGLGSSSLQIASGATVFGNPTFGAGQTLSGTGTMHYQDTITMGGTFSPGDNGTGVGTLTMEGPDGTLALTGTTHFNYTLGSVSDLLALTGSNHLLDLGAGVINFDDFSFTTGAGFGAGSYTLISGATSLTGTLGSSLTGVFGGGYTGTLALSGNDLTLSVAGSAIPEPSTYAALAGAGALALAVLRRRRARVG
jgi:autotransporter-associated beta strand protein